MNNNKDVKITYKVNGVVEFSFGMFIGYEAEMEYNHTTREHTVKEYQFMKPKQKTIESELTIDSVLTSPSPFTEPCTIEYYYELFDKETFRLMVDGMISEDADFEESFKEHLPEIMEYLGEVRKGKACYLCEKKGNNECEYCNGVEFEKVYDDGELYQFWFDKIEVTKIENLERLVKECEEAKQLSEFIYLLLDLEGSPRPEYYCDNLVYKAMWGYFEGALEEANTLHEVLHFLKYNWDMSEWVDLVSTELYDKIKARGKGW